MKISELINYLQVAQKDYGDLDLVIDYGDLDNMLAVNLIFVDESNKYTKLVISGRPVIQIGEF